MNGPIQSSGPGRSTQLRPSNPSVMTNGGALRRSLGFNSQIPVRIGFGNQSSSSSQQASLRARVLERHRQSLVNSTSQSSAAAAAATHQALRSSVSASSASASQQPIDNAFKVYEDRLQTDFRDFRAMCSQLILQEKEEKEKWHTLCLKMMRERDSARQRINTLISERVTNHLSSSSADVPSASSAQEKNVTSKVSKRGRDESAAAQELPSRSSPVESRPIRNLRLSPISSPPRSPSAAINSSPLPSASSESPPPSSSNVLTSSTPPCLDSSSSSAVPLNIMTFNPARSPDDKTCFDVYGEFDIPESRPVKRRKSYDSSSDEPLPFLIAHTDIMYMPMKGRLFCRACL